MNKYNSNGTTLAYERVGEGIPLVLIHGYPLDHSIWNGVLPLLSPGYDLILPDLRGFGESAISDTNWTMDDLAGDIARLLDHLEIKSAFLAGHSMGGYVALAFARQNPGRVRGLALVASQTAADTPEKSRDRIAQAGQIAKDGTGDTVAGMTSKLSADEHVQRAVHDLMRKQKSSGFIGSLHAMAGRTDTMSVLKESTYPLILIHGEADNLIPIQRAHDIQAAVPRAQMIPLQGAGHMPMMEAPQQVADALKRFK